MPEAENQRGARVRAASDAILKHNARCGKPVVFQGIGNDAGACRRAGETGTAEPLRRICRAAKPTVDLNQTRDQSRKPMNAYGALQIEAAIRAISSNAGSGSVSRISYCKRVLSRSVSSCCTVAELESIGIPCILMLRIINYPGAGRMQKRKALRAFNMGDVHSPGG